MAPTVSKLDLSQPQLNQPPSKDGQPPGTPPSTAPTSAHSKDVTPGRAPSKDKQSGGFFRSFSGFMGGSGGGSEAEKQREAEKQAELLRQKELMAAVQDPQQWFVGENNWHAARRTAKTIYEWILGYMKKNQMSKFTNDFDKELGDRQHGPIFILPFAPQDDSFYTHGRDNPHSQVPSEGHPLFNASRATGGESMWRRLSDMQQSGERCVLFPNALPHWNKTHYGKVFQGGLKNFYMVQAMQALSLRPKLLHDIFLHSDVDKGLYVMTFYKNSQYIVVEVDDYMPCDLDGYPVTCASENAPQVMWPSLLEKGFAKLHGHGWEVIGEGGSVEEFLVDLTGGVGGRWSTKDVHPVRMFVYLHELQRETIFVCSVSQENADMRAVKLTTFFPYTVNRVAEFAGHGYVQVHCGAPWVEEAGLLTGAPTELVRDPRFEERPEDGFFWLSIYDFQTYFSTIHECRLMNSGDAGVIKNMPEQRLPYPVTPVYVNNNLAPMYEQVHACSGKIWVKNAPEFHIRVRGCQGNEQPPEIVFTLSQVDTRLSQEYAGRRREHHALLLTCYEEVTGDLYVTVTKSNWLENARDATLAFKAGKFGGNYMITCNLAPTAPARNATLDEEGADGNGPGKAAGLLGSLGNTFASEEVEINRLIARVYTTSKVAVHVNSRNTRFEDGPRVAAPGSLPGRPHAIRWTLVGSGNPDKMLRPDLPESWLQQEGRGLPLAWKYDQKELIQMESNEESEKGECSIM